MKKYQQIKGFTLVEIVVTVLVLGVIMAVIGPMMGEGFVAKEKAEPVIHLDSEGLQAMEFLTRDLRDMRQLDAASASGVSFYTQGGSSLDYVLVGTDLEISGNTLAKNVSAFGLSYYDSTQTLLAAPIGVSSVRCIRITLALSDGGLSRSFDNKVCPRVLVQN